MEKPILFSTSMVQAILTGRKTMTRRVIKPQPTGTDPIYNPSAHAPDRGWYFKGGGVARPRYQGGDILWVRETWCKQFDNTGDDISYRADWEEKDHKVVGELNPYGFEIPKWHPSIHMPKDAARIFLKVTDVWAERLQNMTPYDAWLEGCRIGNSYPWEDHIPELQQMCRGLYVGLWDSLNATRGYSWASNPWVWVISFELESVKVRAYRSTSEPCEWCGKTDKYFGDDFSAVSLYVKYCPNCGRKLKGGDTQC